jgi:hypothetical protein
LDFKIKNNGINSIAAYPEIAERCKYINTSFFVAGDALVIASFLSTF